MTKFREIIAQNQVLQQVGRQPWLGNLPDNTDLKFLKILFSRRPNIERVAFVWFSSLLQLSTREVVDHVIKLELVDWL